MSLINKSDLSYSYSWSVYGGDDPKIKGSPDSTLLNRNEGYEVLYFINKLAKLWDWKHKASGTKVERMLQELPSNIRSQKNVMDWIRKNWESS